MSVSPSWKPTKSFYKAVRIAGKGHENETRKGSNIPYLGHLLGVASMVIEAGGSKDQAMGALLHDLLEDTPTKRPKLKLLVGKKVTEIVWGCTDTTFKRKQQIKCEQKDWSKEQKDTFWWEERKLPYIKKITSKKVDDPALLVSLADKTYNAENTVADLRLCSAEEQHTVWAKFNVGYDYQRQWYRGLLEAFRKDGYKPGMQALFHRFEKAVNEMFPQ